GGEWGAEGLGGVHRDGTALPAQPRLLHQVLCPSQVPEHAVGERQQRGPVTLEDGHAVAHRAAPAASGARRRRLRSTKKAAVDRTTRAISGPRTISVKGAGPSTTRPASPTT